MQQGRKTGKEFFICIVFSSAGHTMTHCVPLRHFAQIPWDAAYRRADLDFPPGTLG